MASPSPTCRRRKANATLPMRGFTLIEVILALVVLGAAIAILGEVMHIANVSASDARAETQAQLLAQSVMDELLAGVSDVSAVSRQPLESDDAVKWLYSVSIGTTDVAGVLPVEVLVEQDLERQLRPVKYRLFRWFPSEQETDENADEAAADQQSGGASGGASGGPT